MRREKGRINNKNVGQCCQEWRKKTTQTLENAPRTRWKRFATVIVPASFIAGAIVFGQATGAIAASFNVSGSQFKVSADKLVGTGFVQYGGMVSEKGGNPANRQPFKYFNKGSMSTVSRFSAVCQIGKLEFGGFLAWLAWLGLHLYYLVGGRNRLMAVISWFVTFLGRGRGQLAITERWVFARRALEQSKEQSAQKSIG